MIQFFELVEEKIHKPREAESIYDLKELLSNFPNEHYHDVLIQLFEKGLVKNEEDEIKLYTAMDTQGNTVAEAELIINHLKWVINPLDELSSKYFKVNGYHVGNEEELQKIAI
jgi:hypothetical protein